ncbi:MAG: hypothetical protein QOD07_2780 [Frankiaceae bacterium]|nr:hypothetical protein [Frankiaceae bacterium]
MLKGDLTSTPFAPLLLSLADEESTGCLHISDAEGDEALIYFRTGLVYAVSVPGRRPQLGAKLVSSGALAPEALAEALEAQRTELQGWKLGELLVHLGYVDQPVVEAFVKEQVNDAIWDLIRWTEGRWRFRKGEKTREDVAPPMRVAELLTTLRERGVEWEAISEVVHGPTAVPVLSAGGGGAAEMTLDADAWSMLCKIDGERSVAELARDCGYTLFEAGQVLVSLVQAGLVDIEEEIEVGPTAVPVTAPDDTLYGANSVSSALAADAAEQAEHDDPLAAVTAAVAALSAESADAPAADDDDLAAFARLVSEVAAGVREDEPEAPAVVARVAVAAAEDPAAGSVPLRPDTQAFATSVERVSAALAEVLGPAHAVDDPFEVPVEMRVKRPAKKKERPGPPPLDPRAARVRAAAAEELAAAHALAQALREAAAGEPSAEELAQQRAAEEAARAAAEAERVAAEEATARAEAERVAAEEAARVAAEEEAARVDAERIAAEAEAARIAAEEAARLAAEEEAARVEAERIAAEEEAARIAAEEEAARLEAERIAAEKEAARLEAERVAAEEETARLAAEEEAARIEAERIAAEEAARLAAEAAEREAAERLAAEKSEAEDQAWTEYWSREAERFAAEEATAAAAEAEREAARQAREFAEQAAERAAAEVEERARAEAEAEAEAEAAEAEEASRRQRNKSAASAALAELAQELPTQPDPVDEAGYVEEPADEPVAVPVSVGAASMEMADTAALLRELSSLGIEDEPAPPPPPRSPSRPSPPAVDPKKKKRGLFGR